MITTSHVTARYAETDQMQVIHHAVYPVWYEVARTEFIRQAGLPYSEMEKQGIMTPLTSLTCHYRFPCVYEDEITIQTQLSKLTPSRLSFHYTLYKNAETTPFHTGETHHGWVDAKTFVPINVKKRFPEIYEQMLKTIEPDTVTK